MEILVKAAWVALIAVHVTPAAVFFVPSLAGRLYGTAASGDLALLLIHRGALFLVIVVVCAWAIFDGRSRRLVSTLVAISVLGFLWLYVGAGVPDGSLRGIAIADAVAVAPLVLVCFDAWGRRSPILGA